MGELNRQSIILYKLNQAMESLRARFHIIDLLKRVKMLRICTPRFY
ncbi:hypothetical protein [Helicobacter rodentium]|nr:hypothetical protein [Helicobacter rodentium]